MSEIYTIKQVAEILKISEYAVKKLIKENKLKALKWNVGYRVNEISLNVFLGHSIHDCIDKELFEKSFNEFQKLEDGKIDKAKFYEYYCSLFIPGSKISPDYYIINNTPDIESISDDVKELNEDSKITLTTTDISTIIKYLNNIQEILESKLR